MAKGPVPDYVARGYTKQDEEGGLTVKLPEDFHKHRWLLRRLFHNLVDLLADYKYDHLLVEEVERWLTFLSASVMGQYAADLIRKGENDATAELRAARKAKAVARAARAAARAARKAKAEAAAKPKASTKTPSKRKAKKTAKKTKAPASRRKKVGRG